MLLVPFVHREFTFFAANLPTRFTATRKDDQNRGKVNSNGK